MMPRKRETPNSESRPSEGRQRSELLVAVQKPDITNDRLFWPVERTAVLAGDRVHSLGQ